MLYKVKVVEIDGPPFREELSTQVDSLAEAVRLFHKLVERGDYYTSLSESGTIRAMVEIWIDADIVSAFVDSAEVIATYKG